MPSENLYILISNLIVRHEILKYQIIVQLKLWTAKFHIELFRGAVTFIYYHYKNELLYLKINDIEKALKSLKIHFLQSLIFICENDHNYDLDSIQNRGL